MGKTNGLKDSGKYLTYFGVFLLLHWIFFFCKSLQKCVIVIIFHSENIKLNGTHSSV